MHGHRPGVPRCMHLGCAQVLLTDTLDCLCADRFALVPITERHPDRRFLCSLVEVLAIEGVQVFIEHFGGLHLQDIAHLLIALAAFPDDQGGISLLLNVPIAEVCQLADTSASGKSDREQSIITLTLQCRAVNLLQSTFDTTWINGMCSVFLWPNVPLNTGDRIVPQNLMLDSIAIERA